MSNHPNNPELRAKERVASKHRVPGTTIRLLSVPSKMPGLSYSVTAGKSCPGAVGGEGSICGSCYAKQGRYVFTNVAKALKGRFDWTRKAMRTPESIDAWVTAVTNAIRDAVDATGEAYFRIHDAGDFFNPTYVKAWCRVVDNLPNVQFWAPTRSYRMAWLPDLTELASRPNMTLRPSALFVNEGAPIVNGLQAGSGVKSDGYNCPAHAQNNQCGDCRKCWTEKETPIYYRLHGHALKSEVA